MLILAVVGLAVLGVIALMLIVHLVVSVVNSYTSALPVPTPRAVIPEVLEALNLPERGRFLEPGCGDGRVLAAVAMSRPKIEAAGIDNNPVTLGVARLRLHGRATLIQGNLMKSDFSEAQRVFAYLSPRLMAALEKRFEQELPQGAQLVSLQFPLPARKVSQEVILKHGKPHARVLYIYDY